MGKEIRWNGSSLEEELEAIRARDNRSVRKPMSFDEERALTERVAEAFKAFDKKEPENEGNG